MFIKIEKNPDGSHAWQHGGVQQEGWAYVPDGMDLPDSFPFMEIETAEVTHPAIEGRRTEVVDGESVETTVVLQKEFTRLEVTSMTVSESDTGEGEE